MKIIGIQNQEKKLRKSNKYTFSSYAYILVCFILSCSASSKKFADSECISKYDLLSKQNVFIFVDEMPKYGKGKTSILPYISRELKYPTQEQFQASFFIEFIINNKGKLIAPRIKGKDFFELTQIEKEILKILNEMPKWKPGICGNNTVPVKMSMSLNISPR